MTNSIDDALSAWARLLGEARYFEAHEVLEGPWLKGAEPQRTFLKGLIHVAVALHHHQRHNRHGARVKYLSALRYLHPYLPAYLGIDLVGLFEQLRPRFAGLLDASVEPASMTKWEAIHVEHIRGDLPDPPAE